MDQVRIGNFLKKLRNEKALTQEQLAERFNVSSRTVSRWENGKNMPDISTLAELSKFYGVNISEILDGERKSENMNEEIKDTLIKVAEYSAAEKEKLLKQLLNNTAIMSFSFFAAIVSLAFKVRKNNDIVFFFLYIGIMLAGASIVNILQIKGSLNKNSSKKIRRVTIPIFYGLLIVLDLAILLLVACYYLIF